MDKSIKILLMSNMYPSKTDGLFGVFVKNFVQNLERQGAVFTKYIVIKGKTSGTVKKAFRYLLHYIRGLFFGIFIQSDLIYIHFLSHHSPLIIILGTFFRKKMVVNIHGSDIMEFNKSKLQKGMNSRALAFAKKIVVPSAYFKEIIQAAFPNLNRHQIVVYPSGGINRRIFKPGPFKPSQEGIINVGMTSRIDKDKGWDVFLESIANLKKRGLSVNGFIIGQGNKEKEMLHLRKVLDLEKDIAFLGLLSQSEIVEQYKKLDLFIFPTALNESLGLVGIEAMSCGLPIVASNSGAPSAYVDSGINGYLFETNNVENLTEKILEYHFLPEEEKRVMRERAISRAEEYDSEKVSANLYHQLLELC